MMTDTDAFQPSRSERKRQMLALQELGKELLTFSEKQRAALGLSEDLHEALCFYDTLRDKEAKRRHMQYIGKLMREVNPGPLRQRMRGIAAGRTQQNVDFHTIEAWRDTLLAGDEALFLQLVNRFGLEEKSLRSLVQQGVKERKTGCPPKQTKALFRLLRQKMEEEDTA